MLQLLAATHATQHATSIDGVVLSLGHSVADLKDEWMRLEQAGFSTIFQSYAWCVTWENSPLSRQYGEVSILVGRDIHGEVLFILPLQRRHVAGLVVVEVLSTHIASYGHGVWHNWCHSQDGKRWFDSHIDEMFAVLGKVDVIALHDMPATLAGVHHPLAPCFNVRSSNNAYTLNLPKSYQTLLESKRSPDSRKNIRWRDNKLAAAGLLEFETELLGAEQSDALGELFDDQKTRLGESGISDPFGPEERLFFHKLLLCTETNTRIQIARLKLNSHGISSILAARHGNTCTDLMTSLALTGYRKYSPGDLALRRLMQHCCSSGITHFDLSVGESNYKKKWADESVELFHIIKGRTLKGRIYALYLQSGQFLRRMVKNNEKLKALFYGFRRRMFARQAIGNRSKSR